MTMNRTAAANINLLWCELIVDELVRNGIDYFCISPGSRSTPLTTAVARHPNAKRIVCLDERAAAFHALGYARASGKPAVLVCTSGTALANYFPAVVEASVDCVPMLILSADRPPELLQTGANQTITQRNMFGSYPRWFFELPCPDEVILPQMVLTTVDQAVYQAGRAPMGVVHLNCMFREPLAPIQHPVSETYSASFAALEEVRKDASESYTRYAATIVQPSEYHITQAANILSAAHHGIIAVGELRTTEERSAVRELAEHLGIPVFADILSGLRTEHLPVVPFFDQILLSPKAQAAFAPDVVLHIGGQMTAKRFAQWMERTPPHHHLVLKPHPFRHDPAHTVTLRLEGDIAQTCRLLREQCEQSALQQRNEAITKHLERLQVLSVQIGEIVRSFVEKHEALSEIAVAQTVTEQTPSEHGIFLGNSMPIRDADMYASPNLRVSRLAANRGASGIDGLIATAAGFAEGLQQPTTLVIGDLSFMHDLTSLALLRSVRQPLTIVLVNNQGGGIFSFLPVAGFDDIFEPFFGTPHSYTFRQAADMFGLEYHCPTTQAEFVETYQMAVQGGGHTLIELRTDRQCNYDEHKNLQAEILAFIETEL